MEFEVQTTVFFRTHVKDLDEKSKRIILDKLRLMKLNPFRYKKLHSNEYSRAFRVRLTIKNKSVRLIYVVIGKTIWAVCLDDRDNDYANLGELIGRYLTDVV